MARPKKYTLPKFPDTLIPRFKAGCEALHEGTIPELKSAVDKAVQEAHKAIKNNPMVDVELATQLAEACHFLLDRYGEFDSTQREIVIGAVRYFAGEGDPISDVGFASGFVDDAKVINYVLQQLNITDRFLRY